MNDPVKGADDPCRTAVRAAFEIALVVGLMAGLLFATQPDRLAVIGLGGRLVLPLRMLAVVLLATWLLRLDGRGWRDVGLTWPTRIRRGTVLVIGGYVVIALLSGLVLKGVLPALHLAPPSAAPLSKVHGDPVEYAFWMLPMTWGSAAFGEEMLFRGFIFDRLRVLVGDRGASLALALQAIVFGAAHMSLGASSMIVAGTIGAAMGGIYLLAGRKLWPCILLHGLIDSVSVTVVFLGLARV